MVLPPFELPGSQPSRHPSAAYRTAWQLLQESNPLLALETLAPALDEDPDATGLLSLRAWAYFQSAQLAKAEQDLVALVDRCPTDVWARFALGRVLERQARYVEALPHLRLAAAMSGDPDHEAGLRRVEDKRLRDL